MTGGKETGVAVPVIQDAFSVTPDELSRALRVVRAYEAHLRKGGGVFALEGRMVDMPVVRAAQNPLMKAELQGLAEPVKGKCHGDG